MRYGSVCSGVEAATVAWHQLGWEPAFFSEIEQFPRAVLAHRFPNVPLHGDFTTIGADDYGPIDLLVGGTPCQSFSVAGLRGGLADDRGNLALEFLRLAQRKRPKWLVWENVPGVLSSNGGRDFGAFLGGLGELGYGWAYRVLDAQYFGVAQRRRRVFVVANLGDARLAQAVLFDRYSMLGDPAPSRKKGARPAAEPERGAGENSWPADVTSCLNAQFGDNYGQDNQHIVDGAPLFVPGVTVMSSGQANAEIADNISPTLNCNRDGAPITFAIHGTQDPDVRVEHSHTLGRNSGQENAIAFKSSHYTRGKDGAPSEVAPPLSAEADKGDQDTLIFDTTQLTNPNNRSNPQPGDPCHTLPSQGHVPAISSEMAVRRLTPVECERLQGFPDGWTDIPYRNQPQCPDGPRYKAMGNSMAVPVMRWIGERIGLVAQAWFEANGDDRKERQAQLMGETR